MNVKGTSNTPDLINHKAGALRRCVISQHQAFVFCTVYTKAQDMALSDQ